MRMWDRSGGRLALLLFLGGVLSGCPSPTRPELMFSPTQLPEARVGESYQATISISGNRTPVGEIHVSRGSLPEGLDLSYQKHANVAEITGRPREAGRWTFTVSAWCYGTQVSGQTGQRVYELIAR